MFLLMGALIIAAIVIADAVARRFVDPSIVPLIVLVVAAVLFAINYIIVSSFERVAGSSKSKSEFIKIMSHRLRTPLSGIKWQLSLVLDSKVNLSEDKMSEFLSEINAQNEEMIKMVNDLLEVSRIEDRSLTLTPSNFSLKELLDEILNTNNARVSAPDNLPNVFADKIRIKNILLHLIDNAIRYSGDKEKVEIALEEIPGGYIRCSVSDKGIGISKEDAKKIFTKFFYKEDAAAYKTGGTGVGLYIAKNIIDKSGGEIGFSAIKDKGATFWFTLPLSSQ